MALKKLEQPINDDSVSLSVDNCHNQATVSRWQDNCQLDALDSIAEEIPVAMIYNGISHVVMMASPCDLEDFAIGFSLSEGIVQTAQEIYDIDVIAADPSARLKTDRDIKSFKLRFIGYETSLDLLSLLKIILDCCVNLGLALRLNGNLCQVKLLRRQ